MNKELIDRAWSYLPKEFKEEVKKEWLLTDDADRLPHDAFLRGKYQMMRDLFGHHNLTSDAEGEDEKLCVSRKQIDALQGEIFKAIMDAHDADDWQDAAHYILDVMPRSFAALFGSKCLPDEACNVASSDVASSEANVESIAHEIAVGDRVRVSKDAPKDFERFKGEEMNYEVVRINPSKTTIQHLLAEGLYGFTLSIPAKYLVKVNAKTKESKPEEPKFSKGNKVIFKLTGKVKVVERIEANGWYVIATPDGKSPLWVKESDIEPWVKNIGPIEPTKGVSPNVYSSGMPMQLANGDLQVHLQVAAMAMQGILANSDEVYRAETCSKARQTPQAVAEYALACGDALIAKCGSEIAK